MSQMSKTALVTGSFDPPTMGHLELIAEAARVFDEVVVCVFRNAEKEYLFSESERLKMLSAMIAERGLSTHVTVDVNDGYVADYAREKGIGFVFRGVRDEKDMAYEIDMARYNHTRNPQLETILWVAPTEQKGISSTEVRFSLQNGVIPDEFLPKSVAELIRNGEFVGKSST